MCNEARYHPWLIGHVPDHLKTQEMCGDAVRKRPWLLQYFPDWFVTQHQIKIWHCNDNELIKWYHCY